MRKKGTKHEDVQLSKDKLNTFESGQIAPEWENQDQELIELLQTGLDSLDRNIPIFEPEQQWLAARLDEHHSIMRRRFIRDLTLFLTVAFTVIAGMAAAFFKLPSLYIFLHAASFMAIPVILLRKEWKRVNRP